MKLLVILIVLFQTQSPALASEMVDLKNNQLESIHFFAQCVDVLEDHPYAILGGAKGTFPQGILYQLKLKSAKEAPVVLEVKWSKSSREFTCKVSEK